MPKFEHGPPMTLGNMRLATLTKMGAREASAGTISFRHSDKGGLMQPVRRPNLELGDS
jgi:hypothetical protein